MDRNTILGIPRRKKISNNTVIEIAGCSPLEILKLQNNPKKIADGEGIGFIYGKGQRKPELQKPYKGLENCGTREYYGAAEPPVRCGESHLSGLTEPPHFVYSVTLPLLDPVHILLS